MCVCVCGVTESVCFCCSSGTLWQPNITVAQHSANDRPPVLAVSFQPDALSEAYLVIVGCYTIQNVLEIYKVRSHKQSFTPQEPKFSSGTKSSLSTQILLRTPGPPQKPRFSGSQVLLQSSGSSLEPRFSSGTKSSLRTQVLLRNPGPSPKPRFSSGDRDLLRNQVLRKHSGPPQEPRSSSGSPVLLRNPGHPQVSKASFKAQVLLRNLGAPQELRSSSETQVLFRNQETRVSDDSCLNDFVSSWRLLLIVFSSECVCVCVCGGGGHSVKGSHLTLKQTKPDEKPTAPSPR